MIVTDARDVSDKLLTEKGCHQSRMAGQFRRADPLDSGREHDHERSDKGLPGVKRALGSSTAKWRIESATRRHSGSREVSVSAKT